MDAREEQARLDWLRDLVESLALYADWGVERFVVAPGRRADIVLAEPAAAATAITDSGAPPPPGPAVPAPRTAAPAPPRTVPPAGAAVVQPAAGLLESAEEELPHLTTEEKIRQLEALRAEIGDCTRCRLSAGRRHLVFGEGSPDAALMFAGEGPGADEDRTGRPFVGRAGQLLDRMIEAMTLRREQVYIANVVKCRPPDNRTPDPEEGATCGPFLLRQIEIIQPRVLVLLGSVAAQYVLGTRKSMGLLRGSVHRHRGAMVIPTYHPAYLLRNPAAKRDVWEDLQKAMGLLGIPVPKRGGAPGGA